MTDTAFALDRAGLQHQPDLDGHVRGGGLRGEPLMGVGHFGKVHLQ